MKKEILIGFLVAVLATISGLILYLEFFSKHTYAKTFTFISEVGLYGEILSLSAIPNLFVFFIFLKKGQDSRAKGVLIATILIAFATFCIYFFKK